MSLPSLAFYDSMVTMCLFGDEPSGYLLDSLVIYRISPRAGEQPDNVQGTTPSQKKCKTTTILKNTWGQFWSSEMQKVPGEKHNK